MIYRIYVKIQRDRTRLKGQSARLPLYFSTPETGNKRTIPANNAKTPVRGHNKRENKRTMQKS